jgi:hypothetical protein
VGMVGWRWKGGDEGWGMEDGEMGEKW